MSDIELKIEVRDEKWKQKAEENVEKWGVQTFLELIAVMTEEMGEVTQAILEAQQEDGDPECIIEELDDMMAVGYQLQQRYEREFEGE